MVLVPIRCQLTRDGIAAGEPGGQKGDTTMERAYRRLGASGLKLSVLSFGSWVTFGPQLNDDLAMESMTAARDAGVNFFDNAESYAGGDSERIMGRVLGNLGWARNSYVVSTKIFWGLSDDVNMSNTLNRKYLMQAIDGSLERFGLDFVDLLFCHRSDPGTPVEETVWAMHDIVASGKALYWGTSEWPAEALLEAYEICDRLHLRKPAMEQPQYNLFNRDRVEVEYRPVIERHGLGLTTWSPLASGQLPGNTSTASRRTAVLLSQVTSGCAGTSLTVPATPRSGRSRRSPTASTARWRSSPLPGAPTTRTFRPSSPGLRARAR